MNEIGTHYLCISDLHLGARYSVLSLGEDPDSQGYSSLTCLVDRLRDYASRVFDSPNPITLIILGDCLDFSFGTMEDAARDFGRLMDALFPTGQDDIFSRELVFIPGNHDHMIWQHAKPMLFADQYQQPRPIKTTLRYQSTPLYDTGCLPSDFLSKLAEPRGVTFNLKYPNWALKDHDSGRQVIFHHGHFCENLYCLISTLIQKITGEAVQDIEELERQNGGWIDFFWSSLGDSPAGRDSSVLLYDVMQNPAASYQYAGKLAAGICLYLDKHFGISSAAEVTTGVSVEKLVTGALDAGLGRLFQAERANFHQHLSSDGIQGLKAYLNGPLLNQVRNEDAGATAYRTAFVFGHTHKPFEEQLKLPGYKHPISVYNTGGWVIDSPSFGGLQGGAVSFIDDKLNVASLRIFQAPVNDCMPPVSAQGALGQTQQENPLLETMRQVLEEDKSDKNRWKEWQDLQVRIAGAIAERAQSSRAKFFDPSSARGVKHFE